MSDQTSRQGCSDNVRAFACDPSAWNRKSRSHLSRLYQCQRWVDHDPLPMVHQCLPCSWRKSSPSRFQSVDFPTQMETTLRLWVPHSQAASLVTGKRRPRLCALSSCGSLAGTPASSFHLCVAMPWPQQSCPKLKNHAEKPEALLFFFPILRT